METTYTTYYAEFDNGNDSAQFESDESAIRFFKGSKCLVIYKESDTSDGRPYIIVYERPTTKHS